MFLTLAVSGLLIIPLIACSFAHPLSRTCQIWANGNVERPTLRQRVWLVRTLHPRHLLPQQHFRSS